jgi:hypothetical protein
MQFFHALAEFEDTKGVIRSRKSKDKQYNGQTKDDIRKNNYLHNITEKINERATRIQPKTGME